MSSVHLDGARLAGAHLEGAILDGAHLLGANLADAHLEGTSMTRAELDGAIMSNGHLEGSDLSFAILRGADLVGAHLEGASLEDAHLEGSMLFGTHLEGAFLAKSHLEGATLHCAKLWNTATSRDTTFGLVDFREADFMTKPANTTIEGIMDRLSLTPNRQTRVKEGLTQTGGETQSLLGSATRGPILINKDDAEHEPFSRYAASVVTDQAVYLPIFVPFMVSEVVGGRSHVATTLATVLSRSNPSRISEVGDHILACRLLEAEKRHIELTSFDMAVFLQRARDCSVSILSQTGVGQMPSPPLRTCPDSN
jgi:hypothetical protein